MPLCGMQAESLPPSDPTKKNGVATSPAKAVEEGIVCFSNILKRRYNKRAVAAVFVFLWPPLRYGFCFGVKP